MACAELFPSGLSFLLAAGSCHSQLWSCCLQHFIWIMSLRARSKIVTFKGSGYWHNINYPGTPSCASLIIYVIPICLGRSADKYFCICSERDQCANVTVFCSETEGNGKRVSKASICGDGRTVDVVFVSLWAPGLCTLSIHPKAVDSGSCSSPSPPPLLNSSSTGLLFQWVVTLPWRRQFTALSLSVSVCLALPSFLPIHSHSLYLSRLMVVVAPRPCRLLDWEPIPEDDQRKPEWNCSHLWHTSPFVPLHNRKGHSVIWKSVSHFQWKA